MSNLQTVFREGQQGLNMGIPTGLGPLDKATGGLQRGMSIGLTAAPKVGKTTLADLAYLINPYEYMLAIGKLDDISWLYWSFEISRIEKEFKIAAHYMHRLYHIFDFTYRGEIYPMSADYLMGRKFKVISEIERELIPVSKEHSDMLGQIYINKIIPLFGQYNENGVKEIEGKIDFIEETDNPTGMYKYTKGQLARKGEFLTSPYTMVENGRDVVKYREIGYRSHNPESYFVVITDHCRKPRREKGYTMKDNVDKWLEYTTEIRNRTKASFINILHSNRGLSNVERLKFAGEAIFPTADDAKDTGNLAEESTIFMTLFNPTDEKYNLKKHMGVDLALNPNYRSLHITEARNVPCPVHMQFNMYGGVNLFTPLT